MSNTSSARPDIRPAHAGSSSTRRVLLWSLLAATAGVMPVGQLAAQGGPPPPVVTAAKPLAQHIAQWDEYTGRFEPVARVEVRARVSGYITQVHFTDGAILNKDDLLFTIDRRPFELAVASAQADVARTKALVTVDETDYQRAQQLVKTAATPVRELDQRKANLDVARAQELAAEAALKTAQLNLEWSEVRAPISGRISDRRVDPGNLVVGGQSNATLLTTIVSLDPIYFVFDGSEADYIRYTRLNAQGQRASSRDAPNPVRARLADEAEFTHVGYMNFVDNEVNPRSGTIRGRAVFENKDFFLTPGTFGRLRLYGGTVDALLIPDAAITSDQARKIVLTVGDDNKIVPKAVTLGGIALGLRAIVGGLKPDDRVVITGLANPFVRPGALVTVQPGEIKPVQGKGDS